MIQEILNQVYESQSLSFEQSFTFAQKCSNLLNSKNKVTEGHRLVIHVLNNWDKLHPSTHEMWTDLVEASGFYPYLDKFKTQFSFFNLPAQLRKELHLSKSLDSKYFHQEQFELLKLLSQEQNVIVSAPTSFGKSLLIEEVIASNNYKNIIIIQPTLALLDETRRKLLKYKNRYKLIVRTSQESSRLKGNIFLFTAERVNEYREFPKIEFLVIDEFYKLSGQRDDERSSSLNNAFHSILNLFNPKFYLLGPNIDGISKGFETKYNAIFFKSKYSLVDSVQVDIYKSYDGEFGDRGKKREFKEKILFELLLDEKFSIEQSIIYCSSPNRVRGLSKKFTEFLIQKKVSKSTNNYPLIEWVENNVSKEWSIIKNLQFDIGIHDGALQKHITSSIIQYFNCGKLKYLFCTSTIIEGVNTSAKNIIYFDRHKGLKPNGRPKEIDFFDYSNIKGRAGRMMEHLVGNIYNFNVPPEDEKIIIDIPFFQQDPIRDEVLIQLNDREILKPDSDQAIALREIPENEREIIKKNGVKVHGQKDIFEILRLEIDNNYDLIHWRSPRYKQLEYILYLAWDNLIIEGESTRPMTKAKLVNMTFNYGMHRNIGELVKSNFNYKKSLLKYKEHKDADIRDLAIQETFQVMKHWFQYKVPKWLSVINEIQRFICYEKGIRPGNYVHYANLIENDFLRENLAILYEYGVPSSAIRKIEPLIPKELDQDEVLEYIKTRGINRNKELIGYEKDKLNENLNLSE